MMIKSFEALFFSFIIIFFCEGSLINTFLVPYQYCEACKYAIVVFNDNPRFPLELPP